MQPLVTLNCLFSGGSFHSPYKLLTHKIWMNNGASKVPPVWKISLSMPYGHCQPGFAFHHKKKRNLDKEDPAVKPYSLFFSPCHATGQSTTGQDLTATWTPRSWGCCPLQCTLIEHIFLYLHLQSLILTLSFLHLLSPSISCFFSERKKFQPAQLFFIRKPFTPMSDHVWSLLLHLSELFPDLI